MADRVRQRFLHDPHQAQQPAGFDLDRLQTRLQRPARRETACRQLRGPAFAQRRPDREQVVRIRPRGIEQQPHVRDAVADRQGELAVRLRLERALAVELAALQQAHRREQLRSETVVQIADQPLPLCVRRHLAFEPRERRVVVLERLGPLLDALLEHGVERAQFLAGRVDPREQARVDDRFRGLRAQHLHEPPAADVECAAAAIVLEIGHPETRTARDERHAQQRQPLRIAPSARDRTFGQCGRIAHGVRLMVAQDVAKTRERQLAVIDPNGGGRDEQLWRFGTLGGDPQP